MEKKIKELTKKLLSIWINNETGEGLFRFTGGYWEVLQPILKKYQPELLKTYENLICEEFTIFNPEVRNAITTNNELKDLENALNYYNNRIGIATAFTTHTIELKNDVVIEYMPNRFVEYDNYEEEE